MSATGPQHMVAADVMRHEVVFAMPSMPVTEACRIMLENHVGGLPVVDVHRRCIGIVTNGDVVRFVERRAGGGQAASRIYKYFDAHAERWEYDVVSSGPDQLLSDVPVSDLMTRLVDFVRPDTPVPEVARMMLNSHHHRVLVLGEGEYLQGIITASDFIPLLAELPAH